jgi:alpha-mannosidase/mannosylglycerate hydrolase
LCDADGVEIPYQLVNQRWNRHGRRRPMRKFPGPDDRHEVDVTVPLRVPACGYTTVVCRPAAKGQPTRYLGTVLTAHHTIENEHLRIRVQPNGTLWLLDKRTAQIYEDLLTFEDVADIGDGWYHGVAVNDECFNSAASTADVAVVADGPYKATLKIALTLNVPDRFCFDRMARSEHTSPLRITSYVTLRRGCEHVEIRICVENTIRDHRLRVLLPTGAKAKSYFADSAFDVVERPIALRADNAEYRELETETKPQYAWTAVHDDARGLGVVSTGLPESAVCDQPDRPIATTLFRSFIKAFLTDGNEGGEMLGTHEFLFSIMPLAGALPRTRLCQLGQALAAAPRSVQIEPRDLLNAPEPVWPPSQSFLRIEPGRAVVTAIQAAGTGEGLIVRMFNPHDEAITETVEWNRPIGSADQLDLEDNPVEAVNVSNGRARVPLRPKQILTLRIA